MPVSNPTVDLAAACLVGLSLPVSLVLGWFFYAQLRRGGFPASHVPHLTLSWGDLLVFTAGLAALVVTAGPLIYPAFIALLIGFLIWRKVDLATLWRFQPADVLRAPGVATGVYLACLPWIGLLLLISLSIGQHFGWPLESQKPVQMFLEAKSPRVIVGILLLACVAAPVGEELLFRGFLYPWIKGRAGRATALVATSLLFGLAHLHWSSFLSLALFGLILNLVYDFTGKLAYAMALHALFNTVTCALLLLYKFTSHPA